MRTKPVDILRHPILEEATNVCHAIEKCGATELLTEAVIKASALVNSIDELLDERYTKGGRVGAVVMPNEVLAGDIKLMFGEDTEKYSLWCEIVNDVFMEYDRTSEGEDAQILIDKIERLLKLVSQREA